MHLTDQSNMNNDKPTIGDCVAIVMMMQSCLASASYDSRLDITKKLRKVKETAYLINGGGGEIMAKPIKTAPHCHFSSTIHHFGEFRHLIFSMIIFDDAKNYYFS